MYLKERDQEKDKKKERGERNKSKEMQFVFKQCNKFHSKKLYIKEMYYTILITRYEF